jgi:hypothetical protein
MVALVGTLGAFHLAQQCVHFLDRQLSIGPYGMMARHCCKVIITRVIDSIASSGFCKISENVS